MNKLLEKINRIKLENPYVRVYLGASKGKDDFYRKFGFITREEANLGSGMILKNGLIIVKIDAFNLKVR